MHVFFNKLSHILKNGHGQECPFSFRCPFFELKKRTKTYIHHKSIFNTYFVYYYTIYALYVSNSNNDYILRINIHKKLNTYSICQKLF